MRDPYEVLGVGRKASADEIKKSFRKLAKKVITRTPNKDDPGRRPALELNSAYELWGDEKKRKAFDAMRSTPKANPKASSSTLRQGRLKADPRQLSPAAGTGRRNRVRELLLWPRRPAPRPRVAGSNSRGHCRRTSRAAFSAAASSGRQPHAETGYEEFEAAQAKGADVALSVSVSAPRRA